MKSNWQKKKFDDCIVKTVQPKGLKQKFFQAIGKYPIIDQSERYISGYTDDERVFKGKLPVVIFGDHTKVMKYVDFPFVLGADGTKIITPNDDFEPKYFYYYLSSISLLSRGYNRHYKLLKELDIPQPPKSTQQKIVLILDSIQAEIGKQKEIIERTRELKKSLMRKLFTEGTRGEALKETEIGRIPKSWTAVRLGDVCQKPQYGFTATSSQDVQIGPKFIRITDIQDDKIDWLHVPYCECQKFDNYSLKDGDILVARIGATTGKTVLFNYHEEAVFASYLIRIRPNLKELHPIYLNYFFQTSFYWNQINLQKGGRLKGGINVPVLQHLTLRLPPLDEQKEIASIVETVDERMSMAEKKKKFYEELFTTTLHRMMSGEVDVESIRI